MWAQRALPAQQVRSCCWLKVSCQGAITPSSLGSRELGEQGLQDWIKASLFAFNSFRGRFVPVKLWWTYFFAVSKGLILMLMEWLLYFCWPLFHAIHCSFHEFSVWAAKKVSCVWGYGVCVCVCLSTFQLPNPPFSWVFQGCLGDAKDDKDSSKIIFIELCVCGDDCGFVGK